MLDDMEQEFNRLLAEAEKSRLEQSSQENSESERSTTDKVDERLADIILETNPKLKKILESHELAKKTGDKSVKITAILLTGEPGLGKSLAGKVLAQKLGLDCTFIQASGLGNEYQDSASSNLDREFKKVINSDAEQVVVIDEIHTLMNSKKQDHRSDMDPATRLCQIMDNNSDKKITIIATANDIKNLSAPLQTRFDRNKIQFAALDERAREKVVRFYAGDMADKACVDKAVKKTKKMSIRHIDAVIQEAKLNAYRRDATRISPEDLDSAVNEITGNMKLSKEGWWDWTTRKSEAALPAIDVGVKVVRLCKDLMGY